MSEALYPVLQGLEIALRNSIHAAATLHYQSERWFTMIPSVLDPREQERIRQATASLMDRGKSREPGRVVAELTFGFWTSLLDVRYEQVLWPVLLRAAFPHMPRRIRTRHYLSGHLNAIRRLRNRVFHHEPVWYLPDLQQQHAQICEAIRWISPPYLQLTRSLDRFPDVLATGDTLYRQALLRALVAPDPV